MAVDLGSMNLEERTKYLEMKERYKKRLRPWYKRWWGISILVILGLILVLTTIAAFYVYDKVKEIKAEDAYNQQIIADKGLQFAIYGSGANYFMGSETAPVKIVEFGDFACPFCEKAHTILRKIVSRYPNKVQIIYRDMPLHENSLELALGARCAGEQGRFWEMHDQLFANQSSLKGTGDELKQIIYGLAGTIGLNATTFDNCYQSNKYLSDINNDFTAGNLLKLKGTPSWFINGKLLSGYIPEEDFFNLLDSYIPTQK